MKALQALSTREYDSEFSEFIRGGFSQYEKAAPAVAAYLDNLYIRVAEEPQRVTLYELMQAAQLRDREGNWEHPHFAQNRIYKLCAALGLEHEIMSGGMMIDH